MHIFMDMKIVSILLISLICLSGCQTTNSNNAKTFTDPLLSSGPDPWVEYYNGTYYITHSTGSSLKLYRTKTVSGLAEAESKTVWTPPASGMNSKEIWAPELHRVN